MVLPDLSGGPAVGNNTGCCVPWKKSLHWAGGESPSEMGAGCAEAAVANGTKLANTRKARIQMSPD